MKNLIINADDFGITAAASSAINDLFKINAISSTSVMVITNSAAQDCEALRRAGFIGSAGVHLQVTGNKFKPLLPSSEVSSLVGNDGYFRAKPEPDKIEIEELEKEWDAQIKKAIELFGQHPSHLDTHHHMHMFEPRTKVFLKLAKRYKLPVRGHKTNSCQSANLFKCLPYTIVDDSWSGQGVGIDRLKESILSIVDFEKGITSELCVHPGKADAELEAVSSWTFVRENDYQCLKQLAEEGWLAKQGITLTTHKKTNEFTGR